MDQLRLQKSSKPVLNMIGSFHRLFDDSELSCEGDGPFQALITPPSPVCVQSDVINYEMNNVIASRQRFARQLGLMSGGRENKNDIKKSQPTL